MNSARRMAWPSIFPKASEQARSGMRHHPKHIAVLIADPGNIPERSIGVGGGNDISVLVGVAIDHLVIGLQLVKGPVIGIIAAFAMGNGYFKGIPLVAGAAQINILGDELPVGIAEQAPGRRWDSQRIWNPLQTPKTLPPSAAKRDTLCIIGLKRAMAPQRR